MQIQALKIIKVGMMTLLSRRDQALKKAALGVTTQLQRAVLYSEIRNNEGCYMQYADKITLKICQCGMK